jgi:hypothetical protein
MSRTLFKSVLAGLLVLVVSAFWTTPVMAAPEPSPVGVAVDVNWHNTVNTTRALYQCPATFCNQGQANAGNDLIEVCLIEAGNVTWALVFNRANEHSGFIPIIQLTGPDPSTRCVGMTPAAEAVGDYTLYQCPYSYCNQGQALSGHLVSRICYRVANGLYWWLSFNANNGHEGFRPAATTGGLPAC